MQIIDNYSKMKGENKPYDFQITDLKRGKGT